MLGMMQDHDRANAWVIRLGENRERRTEEQTHHGYKYPRGETLMHSSSPEFFDF
jgi:hypothetical protein